MDDTDDHRLISRAEALHTSIPRLLEVREAKQYLRLPESSIYRMIWMKILPAVKCGRRVMVSEDDLLAFIKKGGAGLN